MKNLISTLLIILMGCNSEYEFETIASYKAEQSNLSTHLTVVGKVLSGEDLGEGLADGFITSEKFSDTIHFQTTPTKVLTLKYKNIEMINQNSFAPTLLQCLNQMGYIDYNKEELEELGKIVRAATYGPKGTFLKGQTKLIKVQDVTYKTF